MPLFDTHFLKNLWENKYVCEKFSKKTNNFTKICENLMSSKYFNKIGPFCDMLLTSFAVFLRILIVNICLQKY